MEVEKLKALNADLDTISDRYHRAAVSEPGPDSDWLFHICALIAEAQGAAKRVVRLAELRNAKSEIRTTVVPTPAPSTDTLPSR